VRHLDARHRRSGRRASFIVARLDPRSLVRIESGVVEHGLAAAWIGDYAAFAGYQQRYLAESQLSETAPGITEELRVAGRMDDAMRCVITDSSITTVGEACIAVLPTRDGFRYADAAVAQPSHEQSIPSGVEATIEFGTAAQGGFAYSILTPQLPGVGAIGIHFYQGKFGLLFYPLVSRSPVQPRVA
jgi:hypothetical protein